MNRINLILLGIFSFSSGALAYDVQPLLNCDQGRLENICWHEKSAFFSGYVCRAQLFIFGQQAKSDLKNQGIIGPNVNGETILAELQKIPNSSDYKDMSSVFTSSRVFYVKPGQGTITIEAWKMTQPTGGIFIQGASIGSPYTLYNCR